MEGWLRAAARDRAARELEAATVAYYESLTADDQRENDAMAAASAGAARRLRLDEPAGPETRRGRGR